MKIAVVGTEISGLTAAWHLARHHDVTVFEKNDYAGGHSHTVTIAEEGRELGLDTGFIVYNDRTYPRFSRMLADLGEGWHNTTIIATRLGAAGLLLVETRCHLADPEGALLCGGRLGSSAPAAGAARSRGSVGERCD